MTPAWERYDDGKGPLGDQGQSETFLDTARLEYACRHMLSCCLLHATRKRASMELRSWIYGDVIYDQICSAIDYGLERFAFVWRTRPRRKAPHPPSGHLLPAARGEGGGALLRSRNRASH